MYRQDMETLETEGEKAKVAAKETEDESKTTGVSQKDGDLPATRDSKEAGPSNDGSGDITFKTPSFIIPSKKKVQASTSTGGAFKSPDSGIQKTDTNSTETRPISDQEKTVNEMRNDKARAEMIEKMNTEQERSTVVSANPKKMVALSPEQLKQTQAPVPYREPSWGSVCEDKFACEVIKNGIVIENIDLTKKSFYVVGRLPSCDIPMEHPSLSRYHTVLQYSSGKSEQYAKGWYLFDLDSTHGTWINKNKVPPQKYHRLHVDYVLKFGGSTRLFILQGPDTDREEESELSATEMKEQREKQKVEAELLRQAEEEEAERKAELIRQREEAKGCSWGINEEEAEEEDENTENPFAAIEPENEELYINDPKKALNNYFEREGLDLPEYEFGEAGFGKWKCSVELPIDGPNGEPVVAEVIVSGKKKEAVIQCALEACRILDRHGELRKSNKESRKRKEKNWEDDDFYDSDEDVYLDRTGAIEKKREFRKTKVGKVDKTVETYDSLLEKHKKVVEEIEEIETKLEQAKAQAAAMDNEDMDALDAYMSAIKSGMMDTKTKMKLKTQLMELKQEEQKIRKLVNIAKPASLPEIKPKVSGDQIKKTGVLANVGKMKGGVQSKLTRKVVPGPQQDEGSKKIEEVEEEDEEEEMTQEKVQVRGDKKEAYSDKSHVPSSVNHAAVNLESEKAKQENYTPKTLPEIKGPSLPESVESKSVPERNDSSSRMRGPTLPLAAVLEKLAEEAEEQTEDIMVKTDETAVKNSAKRKSKSDLAAKKKVKAGTGGYNEDDPDYAVWLPPENQSGDGKTHLNKKLGY